MTSDSKVSTRGGDSQCRCNGSRRDWSPSLDGISDKYKSDVSSYQPVTYAQMAKEVRIIVLLFLFFRGTCSKSHNDCSRKELHLCSVIKDGKKWNKTHRGIDHWS